MKFKETKLKGSFIIELDLLQDERGFFARSFCQSEFKEKSLDPCVKQCNISFNKAKGTLRGMHFQKHPWEEAKLVRCTKGKIYDVIVDIRPTSQTFKKWIGVELSEDNHKMLYIPVGFAHGFQTLEDNSEVVYQMSQFFHPECSAGFNWNDQNIAIKWPIAKKIFSEKDNNLGQLS